MKANKTTRTKELEQIEAFRAMIDESERRRRRERIYKLVIAGMSALLAASLAVIAKQSACRER